MGAAAGDYDNDGFADLVGQVKGTGNRFSTGTGMKPLPTLRRKPCCWGTVPGLGKAWGVTAGWFDYNNSSTAGLLDLFVVNYLDYNVKTASLCHVEAAPTNCLPNDFHGTPNILYRNNGDGTFTDVSEPSHISRYVGKGMGVAFGGLR